MNIVTLSGKATKDATLEKVAEKDYATFNLAVYRGRNKNGEYESDFFTCDCWNTCAKIASNKVKKGTNVVLSGRLRIDKWEKDGQTRYTPKILVDNVEVVQPASPSASANSTDAPDDDDIPF